MRAYQGITNLLAWQILIKNKVNLTEMYQNESDIFFLVIWKKTLPRKETGWKEQTRKITGEGYKEFN